MLSKYWAIILKLTLYPEHGASTERGTDVVLVVVVVVVLVESVVLVEFAVADAALAFVQKVWSI